MSENQETEKYEDLSDEDFMSKVPGMESQRQETEVDEPEDKSGGLLEDRLDAAASPAPAQEPKNDGEEDEDDPDAAAKPEEDGAKPADDEAEAAASEDETADPDHTTPKQTEPKKEDGPAKGDGETEDTGSEETTAPDYEAMYKKVMASFKANGRDFTPSSPDEAIRLMQMGANYTKKMQVLQPHLKMVRMLEKNGLLDEGKLSFLIDIDKKNPAAIQKLLHDGKIDPLDLDTSTEPDYKPGNHRVSDKEMSFQEAIETVGSTDSGKLTIAHIDKHWDPASKQAIFGNPNLISLIDKQRSNGIYDKISDEIERRRVLGILSNQPFIDAYVAVGDELQAAGLLAPKGGSAPVQTPTSTKPVREALDTRPAQPSRQTANGDKVKALAPGPKTESRPAKIAFDPVNMTDEQIMAVTSIPVS